MDVFWEASKPKFCLSYPSHTPILDFTILTVPSDLHKSWSYSFGNILNFSLIYSTLTPSTLGKINHNIHKYSGHNDQGNQKHITDMINLQKATSCCCISVSPSTQSIQNTENLNREAYYTMFPKHAESWFLQRDNLNIFNWGLRVDFIWIIILT